MFWVSLLFLLFSPALVFGASSRASSISEEEFKELRYYARFAQAPYCTENDDPVRDFSRPRYLRCANQICGSLDNRVQIYFGLPNAVGVQRAIGFIAVDQKQRRIVVSFRGTLLWRDVSMEFGAFSHQSTLPYFPECPGGILEQCKTAINVDTLWSPIRDRVFSALRRLLGKSTFSNYKVVFVGHSIGGAVATLAATDYRAHYPYERKPRAYLYTYAAPRIFNRPMAKYAQSLSQDNKRVTHYLDISVRVPAATLGYEHIGPEYHIEGESLAESNRGNISRLEIPASNFLAPLENPQGAYRHGTAGLPGEPEWHANYLITISSLQCGRLQDKTPMYTDLPNGPFIGGLRDLYNSDGGLEHNDYDDTPIKPNYGSSSSSNNGGGNGRGPQPNSYNGPRPSSVYSSRPKSSYTARPRTSYSPRPRPTSNSAPRPSSYDIPKPSPTYNPGSGPDSNSEPILDFTNGPGPDANFNRGADLSSGSGQGSNSFAWPGA